LLQEEFMADVIADQASLKTVPPARDQHLRDLANCIRFLSMDAVQQAKNAHSGAPMGMADIATVLFRDFMQFEAAEPHWIDRDRFINRGFVQHAEPVIVRNRGRLTKLIAAERAGAAADAPRIVPGPGISQTKCVGTTAHQQPGANHQPIRRQRLVQLPRKATRCWSGHSFILGHVHQSACFVKSIHS